MPTRSLYPNIRTRGCTPPSGDRYIALRQDGREWFVLRDDFLARPRDTIASLAEQGLLIGGAAYAAQLIDLVRQVTEYPHEEVLTHVGWNGALFARPDGEVFVPESAADCQTSAVAFYRTPTRFRREGKRSVWKKELAPALVGDPWLTFLACLPLAAVIRSLLSAPVPAPAIELVANQGESAIWRILVAVSGSMVADVLAPDPVERLIADPQRFTEASRDNLLVIGGLQGYLCGAHDKKRQAAARALLFDHLTAEVGAETNGSGTCAPAVVFIGSRRLAETLELDSNATERLRERLITVRVPDQAIDRLKGRSLLEGTPDPGRGKSLQRMSGSYGHALYAFQQRLVDRCGKKGMLVVQAELDEAFNEFCSNANTRYDDAQPGDQVVHAFALVHAALVMAVRLKILPNAARKSLSVWKVFRRYMEMRPRPLTAADLITNAAELSGVLDVDQVDEGRGKAQLQDVPAFIKTFNSGKKELWVPTARKKDVFDWPMFSKLADFDQWYRGKGEKDRAGGKRVIGGWKHARVLRFRLP